MKNFSTSFKAFLILFIFSGNALAQHTGFNGTLSTDMLNPTLVKPGEQLTFDLFANDFPAIDAGDFALVFGTPDVLAFNSFSSLFDTALGLAPSPTGIGDALFLVGTSGASESGNFAIGTLVFNVIGDAGSMTSLAFSDGPSGWSGPGGAIEIQYDIGYVKVVPVPAAVWFMLSAIGGLGLFSKKRSI